MKDLKTNCVCVVFNADTLIELRLLRNVNHTEKSIAAKKSSKKKKKRIKILSCDLTAYLEIENRILKYCLVL